MSIRTRLDYKATGVKGRNLLLRARNVWSARKNLIKPIDY
jgi:hypothetical protein